MKKLVFICLLLLSFTSGFAKTINDAQIIPHESSIYDEFQKLQNSSKLLVFTQNTPLSVGELKFYLNQFDYESLSPQAKNIYDSIHEFLYTRKNITTFEDFQLALHPQVNLELYYKNNKDIPWTFNYYYKDNFITMPLDMGFGNNLAMGSNLFLGKSLPAAQDEDNFWNIPVNLKNLADTYKSIEFYFPSFAYAGFGKYYDNWGYNLYIAKQGKTIGNTLTGSIIYNSTFETDAYVEFDVYTKALKFTLDVVQISSNRMDNIQQDNTERYLYYHQFDIRVFKNLKFSIMEGSLIASPLSLRFLNPLPFMHQYGGWKNYVTDENADIYGETNFCADFAVMLEYLPLYNLRLYGIYNQIEMQVPWERAGEWGRYDPDSIGFQLGAEYSIYFENNNTLNIATEGFYNSPYMYIKQTPSASLYRVRKDMQTGSKVYSWIGSPYGPDCLGGIIKFTFDSNKKWNAQLSYSFVSQGMNSGNFDLFKKPNKYGYYEYYPSVLYQLIQESAKVTDPEEKLTDKTYTNDEISEIALNMKVSGRPQMTHQIKLKGTYKINDNFELSGQFAYNYIINFNHENKNKNGIELDCSFTYKIF